MPQWPPYCSKSDLNLQQLNCGIKSNLNFQYSVGLPAATSKGQHTHLSAAHVNSQPPSFFAHEQPFSVAIAGQPTSFSIEALFTSIEGSLCKKISIECYQVLLNVKNLVTSMIEAFFNHFKYLM